MIIPSSKIRLPKGQRRSFERKSLSVDFDEDTIDDESFLSSDCRIIDVNASAFFRSFQQIILYKKKSNRFKKNLIQ
jgi:hypothetical protein